MLISPIINFKINQSKKASNITPISPAKLQLRPQLQKDTINFTGIKKQSQSYEQKRQYIIDKGKLGFNSETLEGKDEAFLDRTIAIIEKENDANNAVVIAGYKEKQYKRALELVEKGIVPYNAKDIALLDDRTFKKTLLLINKKIHADTAKNIAELEDKYYVRTLNLIKKGMDANNAYDCAQFSQYEKALELLDLGIAPCYIRGLCGMKNDAFCDEVTNMFKQGASPYDAIKIYKKEDARKTYDNFKDWLGVQSASAIANFEYLEMLNFGQIKALSDLIQTIKRNSGNSDRLSEELSALFKEEKLDESNIGEFSEYTKQVDFKQLRQIAPKTKKYTSKELLTFLKWHFKTETTSFTKEDLTFSEDLTKYLRQNHIKAEKLNKILVAHPLTKREVGEIPKDWLTKTKDKQKAKDEIFSAVSKFTNHPNAEELSKKLSSILNKSASVELLGKGNYAKVYKITIDDAQPTCLKIFPAKIDNYNNPYHGRNTEIQLGLFLNQHSNDFVKMHFGKVCDSKRRDGFLVTQFLDENTKPLENKRPDLKSYKFQYYDNHKNNYIQGKIIDYGGVGITKLSDFPF